MVEKNITKLHKINCDEDGAMEYGADCNIPYVLPILIDINLEEDILARINNLPEFREWGFSPRFLICSRNNTENGGSNFLQCGTTGLGSDVQGKAIYRVHGNNSTCTITITTDSVGG